MNLSDTITSYLDESDYALPPQAFGLLQNAAEMLDSYRFVVARRVLPDVDCMQALETWAPAHHAHITGDA